jgi:protein TonB
MIKEFNPLIFCFTSLALAALLIINSAKAPNELFITATKKNLKKISKTPYLPPSIAAPSKPISVARQLLPKPSSSSNLEQLSAGLVSSSNTGSGGLNVTQGDQNTSALMASSGNVTRSALIIQSTNPVYPTQAQNQGIEGYVVVQIYVNTKGELENVVVLESNPTGIFEAAAISSIKQWKFSGAIDNNKPITSSLKQRIKFELD